MNRPTAWLAIPVMTLASMLGGAAWATPPAAPSGLLAWPTTSTTLTVQFTDNSSDETGFQIQRCTGTLALCQANPGFYSQIGTTVAHFGAGTVSWVDTNSLAARQPYSYRVRAFKNAEFSGFSNATWSAAVFTGLPLIDWINVKTDPRLSVLAVGDGVADDTEALQKALNLINGYWGASPNVLYLPAGTYRITQTLFLEGQHNAQIIGAANGGTIVKWDGPAGIVKCFPADGVHCACADPHIVRARVMFHSEGSPRSVFRRITWDADNTPYVVAFDESWCGANSLYHTNDPNTTSDDTVEFCDDIIGNPWHDPVLHELPPETPHPYSCPNGTGKCPRPDFGYADTTTSHFDSVFKNAWIGLRLGHWNVQNDENTVRRCTFANDTFGVSIEDFNALQHQFWDCSFSGTVRGITNAINDYTFTGTELCYADCGGSLCPDPQQGQFVASASDGTDWAGDFRVFRGRFQSNGQDIYMAPTGKFTFQENWSKGSGQFLYGQGDNTAESPRAVINTQIDDVDPQNLYAGKAVEIRQSGPLILLGNSIDNTYSGGSRTGAVRAHTWSTAEVFAVDNEFTTSSPYTADSDHIRSINDTTIAPFNLTVPPIPTATDPLATLPVFTVSDGANLQKVIDVAEAYGSPAVVHIPSGDYSITSTAHLAAGSDLVLSGNGKTTLVHFGSCTTDPVLEIDGYQSNAVVRDLGLLGGEFCVNKGNGIVVRNANQVEASSRILMSRVDVSSWYESNAVGIALQQSDAVPVDMFDLTLAENNQRDSVGVLIEAGPQAQTPKAIWSATFLGNDWDARVTNGSQGAKVLVGNFYMEGSRHFLDVTGAGGSVDVCASMGKIATFDFLVAQEPAQEDGIHVRSGVPGNVSLVGSSFFDGDIPAGGAVPEGDVIEQNGAASVSIQAIGSAVWRDPEAEVTSAEFTRVSSKFICEPPSSTDPNHDGCSQINGTPSLPDSANVDNADLYAGTNLMRTLSLPHFYDESGWASETYKLAFDNLMLSGSPVKLQVKGDIPSPPSTLLAFNGAPGAVNLTWNDSSPIADAYNEDEFRIERKVSPGSYGFLSPALPQATSYVDATVQELQTYTYRVSAFRTRTGTSATTNESSVSTPLWAPTNLVLGTESDPGVRLTWTDNSSAEANYSVERTGLFPVVIVANSTAYTDGAISGGQTYTYQVRAKNGPNNSGYSNSLQVTTPNAATNPIPANNATNVSKSTNLSWTGGSGAARHDVYWGTNQTSVTNATRSIHPGVTLASALTVTTYDPPGNLSPHTTYSWRVDEVKNGVILKGTVWTFQTQ